MYQILVIFLIKPFIISIAIIDYMFLKFIFSYIKMWQLSVPFYSLISYSLHLFVRKFGKCPYGTTTEGRIYEHLICVYN